MQPQFTEHLDHYYFVKWTEKERNLSFLRSFDLEAFVPASFLKNRNAILLNASHLSFDQGPRKLKKSVGAKTQFLLFIAFLYNIFQKSVGANAPTAPTVTRPLGIWGVFLGLWTPLTFGPYGAPARKFGILLIICFRFLINLFSALFLRS